MSKKYDAKLFQERALRESLKNAEELDFPGIFLDAVNEGETKRAQQLQIEYKRFDENWLNNLETFFPSILQITKDLKSALRYEEEILPIEKTRRTNPESIRHLLRNTRYIRDVGEDGEVIPEKVLNTLSEIEYGIYENRFIMTLVDRLYNYLLQRIEIIRENIMGSKEMHFDYNNSFQLDTTNYEINLNIKSNEEIDIKDIDVHNYRIYEMANDAFKIVSRIYHGPFMQVMKKYQKVKPPILKTQIILKNPDFRNAYLLWLYLDRLNALEYTLERKVKKVDFNQSYIEQIDRSLLMIFSTVFTNSEININDKNVITENVKPNDKTEDYVNNISVDPVPYVLEPNLATEYHLKKAKQFINKQYKEIEKDSNTKQQSLKQVLLDQYSIANQVFNYYFESDQDDDVFDKLINYVNPVRRYDEALNKYLVAKTQSEVTKKLFTDALSLEAKWIKETETLHKEALNYLIERESVENDKIINRLKNEALREIKSYDNTLKTATKKSLQDQRKRNRKSIKDLKDKHKELLKLFRDKEKARVSKQTEAIKEKKKRDRIKLREKQLKEKQRELLKLRKKRDQDKEALRKRLAKQKEDIKARNNKKLENLKNK